MAAACLRSSRSSSSFRDLSLSISMSKSSFFYSSRYSSSSCLFSLIYLSRMVTTLDWSTISFIFLTSSSCSSSCICAFDNKPYYLYYCSRVNELGGNFFCRSSSRRAIFSFFSLDAFIVSCNWVSRSFLSFIIWSGDLYIIFFFIWSKSLCLRMMASFCRPFSVLFLISRSSKADMIPTYGDPLTGDRVSCKPPIEWKLLNYTGNYSPYLPRT